MFRKYPLFVFLLLLTLETASAKVVECRVLTEGTQLCNPYSKKLIRAKEVTYENDRKKLIVAKTLPVPPKKPSPPRPSMEDMIEKYVKIEDSMRFRGSGISPLQEEAKKEEAKKEEIYSRMEIIKRKRQELFDKMKKAKEEREKEEKRQEALRLAEEKKQKALEAEEKKRLKALKQKEEQRKQYGVYQVQKGDSLSRIAAKFNVGTKALKTLNELKDVSTLRVGKKLLIPLSRKRVDAIVKAEVIVEKGDSLSSIAKDFNLSTKEIIALNGLKKNTAIRIGQKIRLPLPHAVKKKRFAKIKKRKKRNRSKLIRPFGKRKLRVTATAYSSHGRQTDKTPFLAAWNNRLRPGMKVIAVSRDMLTKYGMRNGTKVRIAGLSGIYRVRDKMNKRYKKRIDIYMGVDRRRALRWGRRSVVIYW